MKYKDDGDRHWENIPAGSAVKWNTFFIRTEFGKSYYSTNNVTSGSNLFALSCIESGYKGSQVGIDTMYLITLQDYNAAHKKNDTINNIILANNITYSWYTFSYKFFPVAQYIAENDSTIHESGFELKLTENPSVDSSEHQFKLVYILDNGDTFEATSEKIKLLK